MFELKMNKLRAVALLVILLFLGSCVPPPKTVTLALLGDLMVGRGVDPKPASLAYLAPELKAADLSLANLESPLAPGVGQFATKDAYNLCTLSVRAALFPAWGLDMLSLANNHRFDCSPSGTTDTIQALTAVGLVPIGPGPKPVYRIIHGLKLAFLAFDDILAPIDADSAAQAIQSAHSTGAVVVVLIHWGAEYQEGTTARQRSLARQFADAGAALVVGTHPHVLQPAEWIPTTRGRTLVLFSLGNALFDQAGLEDTRQSALVLVTLNSQSVKSARALPFEIDVGNSRIIRPDTQKVRQIHSRINLP